MLDMHQKTHMQDQDKVQNIIQPLRYKENVIRNSMFFSLKRWVSLIVYFLYVTIVSNETPFHFSKFMRHSVCLWRMQSDN